MLSYEPPVRRLIKRLHLMGVLTSAYGELAWPRDGNLDLEIGGIRAQIHGSRTELLMQDIVNYEGKVMEHLISSLRAGDIVFDIGAGLGLYTVLLAQVVRKDGAIIAFEPATQRNKRLEANVKLNGLTNVHCYKKALGEHQGTVRLFDDGTMTPTLVISRVKPRTHYELVKVVEGDRLRSKEHLPVPRLVKIDMEGFELSTIRGLRKTLSNRACEVVCCEVHQTTVSPDSVMDALKSLGFVRFKTYPYGAGCHLLAYKKAS
jgi:FkbM family methyltransferase